MQLHQLRSARTERIEIQGATSDNHLDCMGRNIAWHQTADPTPGNNLGDTKGWYSQAAQCLHAVQTACVFGEQRPCCLKSPRFDPLGQGCLSILSNVQWRGPVWHLGSGSGMWECQEESVPGDRGGVHPANLTNYLPSELQTRSDSEFSILVVAIALPKCILVLAIIHVLAVQRGWRSLWELVNDALHDPTACQGS